jgi:hypothetical protein
MRVRFTSLYVSRRQRTICLFAAVLALAVAWGASATPTPAPSATSSPTPTVAPTLAPAATPTPLTLAKDTAALDVATKEALAVLEELLDELGPRESSTDQEAAAAR